MRVSVGILGFLCFVTVTVAAAVQPAQEARLHVGSLEELSIDGLRSRGYGSSLTVEAPLRAGASAYMASFRSEGLREYARVDLPKGSMPTAGFPVVVFLHGWIGTDAAPTMEFFKSAESDYHQMIQGFVNVGFVVVTPGFRGHGRLQGRPADGIEFMSAWDNGTYTSPAFYAIDVLNLLEGLDSLETVPWPQWGFAGPVKLDPSHVGVIGHSQGGDVALMVLAVCGAGSPLRHGATAGSIWSGTFPSRETQLATYNAMETTPQAFLSGDGTWNHTAVGATGAVNASFVFGFPPDWVETPDVSQWTWQRKVWSAPTVAVAMKQKLDEMYATFNQYVRDIHHATYSLNVSSDGRIAVTHDPRVLRALRRIGAFDREDLLSLPMFLHHSDRDFYSWPEWNADLCQRVNKAGGQCRDFLYHGNTHSLRRSRQPWFSDAETQEGFAQAIARDVDLFRGAGPRAGRSGGR